MKRTNISKIIILIISLCVLILAWFVYQILIWPLIIYDPSSLFKFIEIEDKFLTADNLKFKSYSAYSNIINAFPCTPWKETMNACDNNYNCLKWDEYIIPLHSKLLKNELYNITSFITSDILMYKSNLITEFRAYPCITSFRFDNDTVIIMIDPKITSRSYHTFDVTFKIPFFNNEKIKRTIPTWVIVRYKNIFNKTEMIDIKLNSYDVMNIELISII